MLILVSLAVGLTYGCSVGSLAGLLSGGLVMFALFAFKVATYPVYPETLGMRRERERLERQVSGMTLVVAVLGLAIAEVLL